VRREDYDLDPYLHHDVRNLKGMMKNGMQGRKSSKGSKGSKGGSTASLLTSSNSQWQTEEGYRQQYK
jgi:hypothetical protein